MLYLFDLDGTLISSYMDNTNRDYHTWHPLPGRLEKVQHLMHRSHQVALISNQAGVAFGMISEQDVVKKLSRVAQQLGYSALTLYDGRRDGPLVAGWGQSLEAYVCYSDVRSRDPRYRTSADVARRKPRGAMIREAMATHPGMDVLFVGDRPEDQEAAKAAGVAFTWAEDFFEPPGRV